MGHMARKQAAPGEGEPPEGPFPSPLPFLSEELPTGDSISARSTTVTPAGGHRLFCAGS